MNMKKRIFTRNILMLLLVFPIIAACNSSASKNNKTVVARDTTITESNAYSKLELDSATLENYIKQNKVNAAMAKKMRNFYDNRNYHFAWFSNDGLTEQARAFYNLHNMYIKAKIDTSIFDKQLHATMEKLINDDTFILTPTQITETELHLTQHFFTYTKEVYEGTIDPSQLQWHIPRKKIDAVALLDSLVAKNGTKLDGWEPVNRFYPLLRDQLLKYYEIDKKGGWPKIQLNKKAFKKGDTAKAVISLKKRLSITGDYKGEETSDVFTAQIETALIHAQHRFGLKEDGVLGGETVKELNVSVKNRIEQMLINMERLKWMPNEGNGTRLVANIPEFRLHVFDGKKQEFSMKIVVGKAGHNTVIFTDSLEYVVLSPYWNVPSSIVRNEILPAMRKNKNYLADNNMEQTGTQSGLPVIRQKPGGDNALGRVKFVFPNNYNIYFHDTPAKSLFDQNDRAFSHGCIRLEQPQRLAEYLLRNDSDWPKSKIIDYMYSGKNTWIKLKHKIPVYIVYFTAWVSNDGTLNFRDDLYGHDARMKKMMFKDQ
jgi:murein L,D-transpeptidase YcbB/YkuD